jgi:glycosyltransferase involved in cell wall biosynthesis
VPIITPSIGGLNYTAGRAGLVFPPDDLTALTSRILELLDDPDHAAELYRKSYPLVISGLSGRCDD